MPVAIYKPIKNVVFDTKMRMARKRSRRQMVRVDEVRKLYQKQDTPRAVNFAFDQNPAIAHTYCWTRFLNRDTAFVFGPEKFARAIDAAVLYGTLSKVKGGHYEVEFRQVAEIPSSLDFGEITERMVRLLEKDIVREPQYWLWTHRRWKARKRDRINPRIAKASPNPCIPWIELMD